MSQHDINQKPSFLDRGTVTALVLVAAVWFGWSKWVEKTYPQAPTEQKSAEPLNAGEKPAAQSSTVATGGASASSGATTGATTGAKTNVAATRDTKKIDQVSAFNTDKLGATLHSAGMGLTGVEIKGYKTREDQPIVVGRGAHGLFATYLVDSVEPVFFEVTGAGGNWIGRAEIQGLKIEKTISPITEGQAAGKAVKIVTKASGDLSQFSGFRVALGDEIKAPGSSSMFAPSYDHHDWYVKYDDTKARLVINPEKPEAIDHQNVFAAALSSHYFSAAIADKSKLRPQFKTQPLVTNNEKSEALAFLDYRLGSKLDEFQTEQIAYIGAKEVEPMRAADADLDRVIDYGMFAVIAEPLLWLMRFFYGLFGNWGFAIIGLTIVVRALVMPFNIYSFKSMKVMQKIQPQIAAVRERYKEDPRRMNEEVMKMMRENKANPLGGCLPMLLQLPVFFALYQVLAQSIDLYRQPFIFWIHDLSVKDPFFVLPVLMGISMFVQQKITPVADPQQAKILQWMPVIFSFLMISLPSGLTLYIFVSTLFGIIQQYVFMRDRSGAHTQSKEQKTVREVKA